MRQQSSALLANLLHFGRVLHSLGVDVQAGRMVDVAAALAYVDIGRRTDFYFTLRSLLVHRQADLGRFDEAFRVFWRSTPEHWPPHAVSFLVFLVGPSTDLSGKTGSSNTPPARTSVAFLTEWAADIGSLATSATWS